MIVKPPMKSGYFLTFRVGIKQGIPPVYTSGKRIILSGKTASPLYSPRVGEKCENDAQQ